MLIVALAAFAGICTASQRYQGVKCNPNTRLLQRLQLFLPTRFFELSQSTLDGRKLFVFYIANSSAQTKLQVYDSLSGALLSQRDFNIEFWSSPRLLSPSGKYVAFVNNTGLVVQQLISDQDKSEDGEERILSQYIKDGLSAAWNSDESMFITASALLLADRKPRNMTLTLWSSLGVMIRNWIFPETTFDSVSICWSPGTLITVVSSSLKTSRIRTVWYDLNGTQISSAIIRDMETSNIVCNSLLW